MDSTSTLAEKWSACWMYPLNVTSFFFSVLKTPLPFPSKEGGKGRSCEKKHTCLSYARNCVWVLKKNTSFCKLSWPYLRLSPIIHKKTRYSIVEYLKLWNLETARGFRLLLPPHCVEHSTPTCWNLWNGSPHYCMSFASDSQHGPWVSTTNSLGLWHRIKPICSLWSHLLLKNVLFSVCQKTITQDLNLGGW